MNVIAMDLVMTVLMMKRGSDQDPPLVLGDGPAVHCQKYQMTKRGNPKGV
jgi:hypothetical protein